MGYRSPIVICGSSESDAVVAYLSGLPNFTIQNISRTSEYVFIRLETYNSAEADRLGMRDDFSVYSEKTLYLLREPYWSYETPTRPPAVYRQHYEIATNEQGVKNTWSDGLVYDLDPRF